ncbi:hypothetical protein R1flu_000799 [Riccia fluitans]|uniref:Uncharacterized protein n=1 Tax=Riccia fluitans TaxID=41844 RepID=A0ABD1Y1F7_9MARC
MEKDVVWKPGSWTSKPAVPEPILKEDEHSESEKLKATLLRVKMQCMTKMCVESVGLQEMMSLHSITPVLAAGASINAENAPSRLPFKQELLIGLVM